MFKLLTEKRWEIFYVLGSFAPLAILATSFPKMKGVEFLIILIIWLSFFQLYFCPKVLKLNIVNEDEK